MHCTRQQAVLLRLQLPTGEPPTNLAQLARAVEIDITTTPNLELPSATMLNGTTAAILVHEELAPADQLRAALRELKNLIDLPARLRMADQAFDDAVYEALADRFADMVLDTHGP
jgi:glyoxylate carboligase